MDLLSTWLMRSSGLLMAVHMATLVAGAVEQLPALEVDAGADCSGPSAEASDSADVCCCCCCCNCGCC